MIAFAYFLLKMLVCSGLLFSYYHVALRNKKFHQWNRFYLLASVIISIAVPCLQFNVWLDSADGASDIKILKVVYSADEYVANATAGGSRLSMNQWITILYSLISISILVIFIRAVSAIYDIIRMNPVVSIDDIKFVNTEERNAPFSFLNYVVWNKQIDLESPSGKQIFQHELAHVREKHSFDKLFTQIVLTVFWCNPFFWLIQKELKMIHEFIADQKSGAQSDVHAFASMILHAAYPQHYTHLTNPFFNSSIKRRISMLTRNNNPRLSYLSRILALPLMAFLILAFTVKQNKSDKASANSSAQEMLEKAINAYPQSAGSPSDIKKVAKLVTIDSISLNDTSGKGALVIIDGDEVGTLSSFSALDQLISPDQIESINILKGESATNKYGAKARDGAIEITTKNSNLPNGDIKTNNIKLRESNISDTSTMLRYRGLGSVKPLVIVDGKEMANWEQVPAESIESMTVLKGETGIKLYGDKAKDGVIEIITKPSKDGEKIREIPLDGVKITPTHKKVSKDLNEVVVVGFGNNNGASNKTFEKVEKEAEFPGGENAWKKYLARNLNVQVPFNNNAPSGRYQVIVRFLVALDGGISEIKAITNHGYGMEEEVIRVISSGPKWTPAQQNGKDVIAWRSQPVTFVMQAK